MDLIHMNHFSLRIWPQQGQHLALNEYLTAVLAQELEPCCLALTREPVGSVEGLAKYPFLEGPQAHHVFVRSARRRLR